MADLNLTRQECARRAEQVRLLEHHVRLDLRHAADPAEKTFESRSTVRFTATDDASWIDIVAQEIVSATLNGTALDVSGYDGARLPLPGLAPVNELVVHARCLYSRTGEGMHRFTDPSDGETYLYTHFEPTDSRRVFAVFEQPDLKCRFTFEVVADARWLIRSGQSEVSRREYDGLADVRFAPTPLQSSYVTAVAVGPYHLVTDLWSVDRAGGTRHEVPLGVMCRASMADHLDAEDILQVTKQGLRYFDELFGFPYPWGKYDQIFVPEYNIGAMENPGLVTFVESFVHRGQPTLPELASRAEVILHEMAHMWFGNLATMRWWDGLWLKESFADLMGYQASVEATGYTSGWTSFAIGRKQWAYTQDQLPTTHPIAADILDVEAAAQNFDGITYAKGAAVLKQLQAYVGRDRFDDGVRRYFAQHAYGSTELEDFLEPLSAASGRDLSIWAQAWLRTSGPSEISAEAREDRSEDVLVVRQATPETAGAAVDPRPHVFSVGVYTEKDAALQRTQLLRVGLDGPSVEARLDRAVRDSPDLVLPNDEDFTYAISRLDPGSQETAHRLLSTVPSEVSRALIWSALWNHTRDAQLCPVRFLETVRGQLITEGSSFLLQSVLAMARSAVHHFLQGDDQRRTATDLARLAHSRMTQTTGDVQLVWARALAWFGALTPDVAPLIQPLVTEDQPPPWLNVDHELRWSFVTALSATGARPRTLLAQDLRRDFTMSGQTSYDQALASLPESEAKAQAWHSLADASGAGLTNDRQRALIVGFGQPVSSDLTREYAEPYFDVLTTVWAQQSQTMASRFVSGMFPAPQASDDVTADDEPVVVMARDWLRRHDEAPAALRRGVVEGLDDVERTLRVRAAR
ncbi:aminopeptidase N [Allobranchiibius huperziae]|uniref:Aminopeptidase N n=1 Tax=Allobranchiibius huperziae TaxID=1874116 RepID=A0A853DC77_9MICO|nr:aminopeptidase N [Allobranchiibius huperziae]